MAKREIGGGNLKPFPPVVRFAEKDGSVFVGNLMGSKEGKFGLNFSFTVVKGDVSIARKENGVWNEVAVAIGDEVTVLTSKNGQLEDKLNKVNVGETTTITFIGKQLNPKSGRYFNNYRVEVE